MKVIRWRVALKKNICITGIKTGMQVPVYNEPVKERTVRLVTYNVGI